MKERDYVIATALARLRIASYVLREVMIPDDMGDRINYILIDAIAGINHLADFFQRKLD